MTLLNFFLNSSAVALMTTGNSFSNGLFSDGSSAAVSGISVGSISGWVDGSHVTSAIWRLIVRRILRRTWPSGVSAIC